MAENAAAQKLEIRITIGSIRISVLHVIWTSVFVNKKIMSSRNVSMIGI